jgi:hypothetical protein
LIAYGEPAEEIVKVAHDREVGLIVMTLVGSALEGPRIGSVTYRVLSAAGRLVLALPPGLPAEAHRAKAGNFSEPVEKATRTRQSREPRSAISGSKSTNSPVGTAVALKAGGTRSHT